MTPTVPKITTLMTAEELSAKLNRMISPERLLELVEARLVPHYEFDGRVLFNRKEVADWLDANLLCKVPGRPVPTSIHLTPLVLGSAPPDIPMEIRAIAPYLLPLPIRSLDYAKFSGVYFLCREGKVVYIGQGVDVANRVGAHCGTKAFDFAFCLRIPQSDLNYVETHLIHKLQPEYNYGSNGRLVTPGTGWVAGKAASEFAQELALKVPPTLGCEAGIVALDEDTTGRTRRIPVAASP